MCEYNEKKRKDYKFHVNLIIDIIGIIVLIAIPMIMIVLTY